MTKKVAKPLPDKDGVKGTRANWSWGKNYFPPERKGRT